MTKSSGKLHGIVCRCGVSILFEVVYTCTEWYDGPRGGIADYHGEPHLFISEWANGADMDTDTFLLSSVNPEVFQLAIEDWTIW